MNKQVFQEATRLSDLLASRWYDPVTEAMFEFDVDTPARQAAFLAQIAHESAGFTQLMESFNYSVEGLKIFGMRLSEQQRARLGRQSGERVLPLGRQQEIANIVYGGRFGNHEASSGDGWRYRGRGLKQITFADNYCDCGDALGVDLLAQPELLEQDTYAALSAGWFWYSRGLNEFADRGDFDGTTRIINGTAMVGSEQRTLFWNRAKQVLMA
ncbi:glycoside hydrolase family 19 protein [Burkholderia sp. GbtcB21]|uniref:glycoside hydrolase family 19 protein n=1 Tax=Burkholderia sp. GbtcB21 TaxID=2824766 RepID=UPI001C2F2148|nr:glycoside hydrolase family 19 protein [Burkholderia sp. GbtcB21]